MNQLMRALPPKSNGFITSSLQTGLEVMQMQLMQCVPDGHANVLLKLRASAKRFNPTSFSWSAVRSSQAFSSSKACHVEHKPCPVPCNHPLDRQAHDTNLRTSLTARHHSAAREVRNSIAFKDPPAPKGRGLTNARSAPFKPAIAVAIHTEQPTTWHQSSAPAHP